MSSIQKTIATRYYTDPDYYQLDKDRIYYVSWQFVCHQSELGATGTYKTINIADESIVVVQGKDDQIRAFYNVCRHRAHRIVEGQGRCQRLVCPYHAWTYNLDGSLFAARGTETVAGFDPTRIHLKPVRLELFCGFVFVNLDPDALSLKDQYGGLEQEILEKKPGLPEMELVQEDRIPHACNWKVSVENFSECYHCPVAHKYITTNLYSGTEYRITLAGDVVRHFSPRLEDREIHGDLHIWFIWPNVAIQLHPFYRAISVRQFLPMAVRETEYVYRWYADPDLPTDQRQAIADLGGKTYHDTNGLEDQSIVANVQLGLESRSYDRGPLVITAEASAESEHAVAYFQNRYLQIIDGQDSV